MRSTIQNNRKSLIQIVLNFTPSWFSVNMGTGIISILIYNAPHQFHGMKYIAIVFYLLNCVLFTVFSLVTLARYIVFPYVWKRMLNHPAQSLFIGTLPMGLATIVNATVLIAVPAFGHWAVILSWTLWWIDVALTLLSCLGVPFMMFNAHQLQIEKMNATWLLPIVPAVVAAASGGFVATVLDPHQGLITLVISYCLWGLGVGISILIMAIYVYRLTIHKLPAPEAIVSAFLPLGPLGQGSFGIIQMAQAGRAVFPATKFLNESGAADVIFIISVMVGLLMWGMGFFWLFHGVTSVLARLISGKIPFSIGFWGFIFPLGVYTSATIALAKALPSAFFSYLAMVFIVLLVILWLYVAGGTLKRMLDRSMFVAPCLSEMRGNQVVPEIVADNSPRRVQGT